MYAVMRRRGGPDFEVDLQISIFWVQPVKIAPSTLQDGLQTFPAKSLSSETVDMSNEGLWRKNGTVSLTSDTAVEKLPQVQDRHYALPPKEGYTHEDRTPIHLRLADGLNEF
jgi:hypothetical protein